MSPLTVAAFGEFMLRLSPPGKERLFQTSRFSATFGGGEANVLVSLARFGHQARYVSVIPENPVGEAAVAELRKHGLNTEFIIRRGKRLGLYFSETGAAQRASQIIYDREHSGLAEARPGDIDWARVLTGVDWFHTTGITPALTQSAADLTLEALRSARARKIKISLDLNYRAKLWTYGKSAPEVMRQLASQADILMANEEDCQKSLGIDVEARTTKGILDVRSYEKLTETVMDQFPQLESVAVTLRESYGADHNGWSAVLRDRSGFLVGPKYHVSCIVDRIGSGDAFAAGLIHGLNAFPTAKEALDFAVAASCLKHTVPGDFNLVSEAEVMKLLKGDESGRVQR